MKYGYIRISTKEQHIDRQLTAMYEEGIMKSHIYVDVSSGKNFNRKSYRKLLKTLKKGDELVIKSIDRLGRNYDEIIEQWHFLVKDKEIDIKVIDFNLLNTKSGMNDSITGKFIADLVLQVLSYVAQVERENILQRQQEGIREAKKKGIVFGRPKLEKPDHFPEIYAKWLHREMSVQEAADALGVPKTTCYRWLKTQEQSRGN